MQSRRGHRSLAATATQRRQSRATAATADNICGWNPTLSVDHIIVDDARALLQQVATQLGKALLASNAVTQDRARQVSRLVARQRETDDQRRSERGARDDVGGGATHNVFADHADDNVVDDKRRGIGERRHVLVWLRERER